MNPIKAAMNIALEMRFRGPFLFVVYFAVSRRAINPHWRDLEASALAPLSRWGIQLGAGPISFSGTVARPPAVIRNKK